MSNLLVGVIFIQILMFYHQDLMDEARKNKSVWIGFPLFALLLILVPYGDATIAHSISILGKYADIILIPIFLVALKKANAKKKAENAFLTSSSIVLLFSYLLKLGIVSYQPWMWFDAVHGGAAFRNYLTQNFFMAFAVYLAMLRMVQSGPGLNGFCWALFVTAGLIDIFGLVIGRSGQVAMLVLMTWLVIGSAWFKSSRKKTKIGAVAALVCILASLPMLVYQLMPDSAIYSRFKLAVTEASSWDPEVPDASSSVGTRLGYYYQSLGLIAERPLLGYGTGGFSKAYASRSGGSESAPTENPHNQYLLVAVQGGVVGLSALLALFALAWKYCQNLQNPSDRNAGSGLVLIYAINSVYNSPLLDHAEGLFFAFMLSIWLSGTQINKNSENNLAHK